MSSKRFPSGMRDLFIGLTLCWAMTGACVAPVQAHNVTVFAWVEGDTVHVESKFAGGRRPKDAPIEVYDGAGNLLIKGSTDENGEFSFPAPQKTALKIVLTAGMGHRAEWTIPREELGDVPEAAAADAPAATEPAAKSAPAASGRGRLTQAELQQALEQALDKKLKPLIQMAAESQYAGPSLNEIIGGIGYIFGLVGVGAYVHARRNRRSAE